MTAKGPMMAEFVSLLQLSPMKQGMGRGPRPEPQVFWVANTYLCRAPAGVFNAMFPTLTSIHSSVQVQLPWFNVMQQVASDMITALQQAEMQQIINQGQSILKSQEILRKAAQEKSDMVSQQIHDRFADVMATHDMMQTREMQYITNTGNYRDPQSVAFPGKTFSEDYKHTYH